MALLLGWPGRSTHLRACWCCPAQPLPSGLGVTTLGLNLGTAPGGARCRLPASSLRARTLARPRLWTSSPEASNLFQPLRGQRPRRVTREACPALRKLTKAGQRRAVPTPLGPGSRTKSFPEPRGPPFLFYAPPHLPGRRPSLPCSASTHTPGSFRSDSPCSPETQQWPLCWPATHRGAEPHAY